MLEVPRIRSHNTYMENKMKVEIGDIVSVAGQIWTQRVVYVDGDQFVGKDSGTGWLKTFTVAQVQI